MDVVLCAAVVALIGFGVVMVYSASAFDGTVRFGDPQYYLRRQGIYAGLALVVVFVTSRIDYHRLRTLTYPLIVAVVGLMLATILGLGHRAGNAYRWLAIGPVHVQPAELAKVALVLWLAYSLSKKSDRIRTFTVGFLPHLLMAGLLMALCLKQPDFGSAVVLLLLTFSMMFVSGVRLPYIVSFAAVLGVLGTIAVRFSGYRYARYLSWLDMEQHRQDLAYQPFQAAMSFGSGGLFGVGLGRGLQVLYLPEAHTDFVAAIIGEELGFVGVCALTGIFGIVVARGIKIAFEAADDYGSYLAFGLSMLFGMQVLINLSVAMAILPTKGLTLPLISYGGSSLLVSAAAIGILLNVSRSRSVVRASVEAVGPEPSASVVVAASAEEAS
ncbi:MAG: putative lipid II flippase FtsW [Myxococcales bacterium]|nr:putative lipid II flippase FtsW [Myxococcales bacterium]